MMQKKITILILSLFAWCMPGMRFSAWGQQSPGSIQAYPSTETFHFGWGPGILGRQDLLLSPMSTVNAGMLNITTRFSRQKRKRFTVETNISLFRPARFKSYTYWTDPGSDTLQTVKHYFSQVEIRLSRGIWQSGTDQKINWGIDGGFTTTIQPCSFLTAQFGSFNYTALFSLEPILWAEIESEKGKRLRASLNVPLLSWVARSPYLLNDDEYIENVASHSGVKTFFAYVGDGNLQTFNTLQRMTFGLQGTLPLTEKWSLSAEYKLDFLHLRNPAPLFSYLHTLHFVAGYQF